MTSRFQIQEMVSQDATRVVFLAEEEGTGERVALRRFISANGGEEGREGFLDAIASISRLRHPSLRAVVEGGVDPVDGVPFVATEWVEGEVLGELLDNAVLSEDDGLVMVFQALDLLGVVQGHSGTKANWLEFRVDDIIVRQTDEGPCFTFWTTLARWLSEQDGKEAVGELASLAGRCCGISAGAAQPESRLGEWLLFVRDNEPSVAEAIGALKAMAQMEHKPTAQGRVLTRSPFPTPGPVPPVGSRPVPVVKQGSPATGLLVTVGIVVVAGLIALAAVLVVNSRNERNRVAVVEADSPADLPPEDPEPAEPGVEVPKPVVPRVAETDPDVVEAGPPERAAAVESAEERLKRTMAERERISGKTHFKADEGDEIGQKVGDVVYVTGVVMEVEELLVSGVDSFRFELGPGKESAGVFIQMDKALAPGKSLDDFKDYEGKNLTFRGKANKLTYSKRAYLVIDSPEAISTVASK